MLTLSQKNPRLQSARERRTAQHTAKYVTIVIGRGIFSKSKKKTDVKEVVTDGTDSEANQISVGELAGMFAVTAALHKVTRSVNKIKVPHMLYEQLQWVKRSPPGHPTCLLSVTVSTKG